MGGRTFTNFCEGKRCVLLVVPELNSLTHKAGVPLRNHTDGNCPGVKQDQVRICRDSALRGAYGQVA